MESRYFYQVFKKYTGKTAFEYRASLSSRTGLTGRASILISFFVGCPPIMCVLIAVMSFDYITGIICGAMGRSLKNDNGGLSSSAAFTGLLKKVVILVVTLCFVFLCGLLCDYVFLCVTVSVMG